MLICPVKIDGGGVYIGDCHANQGDGELSLHTTDITAEASVRVDVIKNLILDGPLLLPVAEDLPFITRPYSQEELVAGERLAQRYHLNLQRHCGPVQFIGTGPTINEAADDALERAGDVLQMTGKGFSPPQATRFEPVVRRVLALVLACRAPFGD